MSFDPWEWVTGSDDVEWDVEDEPDFDADELGIDPEEEREEGDEPDDERDRR